MDELIEQYYKMTNWGSAQIIYDRLKMEGIKKITMKMIKEYINKKEETQLFKEDKIIKTSYTPITASEPNEFWCIDIFVLAKYHNYNKGYLYIFACIDVFTRKAYCIPMKEKDIENTTEDLKMIIKQAGAPKVIISDSDSSFTGYEFQQLLKKYNIIHNTVILNDHHSLGIIDRFARTLKTILSKSFKINDNYNWIDILDEVVNRYNNNPHSSIAHIKPNEADKGEYKNIILEINQAKSKLNPFTNKFKPDDNVRIKIGGLFKKGTEQRFSSEIYKVKSIHGTSVTLTNDKTYKATSLMLVSKDFIKVEKPKSKPIKQVTKDHKNELLHKRIEVKESNIIETKRVRKRNTKYDD